MRHKASLLGPPLMCRLALAILLSSLGLSPLFAGDKTVPASADLESPDPELDTPTTTTNANNRFTQDDFAFVERMLAAQATDVRSEPQDLAHLRRLRGLLQVHLKNSNPSTGEEKQLLSRLEAFLKQRVRKHRSSRSARETLGMFYLFLDEPEKAKAIFDKIGPASKRDLYHPLRKAYAYLRLADYGKARQQLDLIFTAMNKRTPLQLSSPIFCTSITAFRLYRPRPAVPLKPGEDTLIYLELTGVGFRDQGEDGASCDLSFGLIIRNDLQKVVWREPAYGQWVQPYQGPINDVHVSIALRIPNNLESGQHHLFITCNDRVTSHQGKTDVGFEVRKAGSGKASAKGTPSGGPPEKGEEGEDATDEKVRALQEKVAELEKREFQRQAERMRERQERSGEVLKRHSGTRSW